MSKKARVLNHVAVDVVDGSIEEMFHPDIATTFEVVPDSVESGWTRDAKSGEWSAPLLVDQMPEPAPIPPKVSPVEFKLLFTSPERVAIKTSGDPIVDDFFELVENQRIVNAADPARGLIDFGLQSTQDALTYMVMRGLLTDERRAEIMSGQVK